MVYWWKDNSVGIAVTGVAIDVVLLLGDFIGDDEGARDDHHQRQNTSNDGWPEEQHVVGEARVIRWAKLRIFFASEQKKKHSWDIFEWLYVPQGLRTWV